MLNSAERAISLDNADSQILADGLPHARRVDAISADTVGHVLRNELKRWLKSMSCSPPEQDAAFIIAMEQVQIVYHHSDSINLPCCDAQRRPRCSQDHGSIDESSPILVRAF